MKECQTCKSCYADAVTHCPKDGMPTFHSIGGEPILEEKYTLERRLGQGGMGVVYKANHKYLKTSHAIKVILPDLVGNDPQLVTRFRQEALAAAAIRHQNVVAVTDYGVAQGTMPFLVMEYVEGDSLHDLLTREKRLSPDRAFEVISAICAGVGAAHRQGIVHRDLKPLNVMMQKGRPLSEGIKILDFGLAKIKSGELLGSFIQAQTTGLMGSPYYMAPEQWADEEPDVRSDVYSLGVILYQMLAGDVPFKGSSIPAIMKKHLSDLPPTFAEMNAQIPYEIEQVVFHTLVKDRFTRTQSTDELVNEFRNGLGFSTQPIINQPTAGLPQMPITPVKIWTKPAQSTVYVDNVVVGQTQSDGGLLLEGLQSGNHFIRVTKEGFYDTQRNISCDGRPQQVTIELQSVAQTQGKFDSTSNTPQHLASQTQNSIHESVSPNYQQSVITESPKRGLSGVMLGIIGISGVLLLSIIGITSVYFSGIFGNGQSVSISNTAANTTKSQIPIITTGDMLKISGGKFLMGNDKGKPEETPAHEVTVGSFMMDKHEVTNAEYYEFVKGTDYPNPTHWAEADKKPIEAEKNNPVVMVSLDDAKKFAEWRSKRDNVTYRLPTEEEWEYAARNGAKATMYPWGNDWNDEAAAVGKSSIQKVLAFPKGQNEAGVNDLIGNVWEWTNTKGEVYKGFKGNSDIKNGLYVVRGGAVASTSPKGEKPVTATSRIFVLPTEKKVVVGFRLVRDVD
jgi:eukaryotic-like serine/threonine-protein kinase